VLVVVRLHRARPHHRVGERDPSIARVHRAAVPRVAEPCSRETRCPMARRCRCAERPSSRDDAHAARYDVTITSPRPSGGPSRLLPEP
jgi:hypothetical protein